MSTNVRATISTKNKYWIDKHRYYELKHFCLQYPEWKKQLIKVDGYSKQCIEIAKSSNKSNIGDPTANSVAIKLLYAQKIRMIEVAALQADSELSYYILKGVTEGRSYDNLLIMWGIPCSKDTYYDRYRRFFYILHTLRE